MKRPGLKWELMLLCVVLVTIPTTLMGALGYYSYQSFAESALESQLKQRSEEMHALANTFIEQKDRVLKREEALVLKRIESIALTSQQVLLTLPVSMKPKKEGEDPDPHRILQKLSDIRLNRGGHIFLLDDNNSPVFNSALLENHSRPRFYNHFLGLIEEAMPLLLSGEVISIRYPWNLTEKGNYHYRQTALAFLENWQMVLGVTINETDYKSTAFERKLQNELRNRLAIERIGDRGYIWVLNSKGEYIVSRDHLRDGENMSNVVDQNGQSLVQYMVNQAISQPNGDSKMIYYHWRNIGEEKPLPKAAAVTYVSEWDWVIGASADLDEFYAGLNDIQKQIFYICIVFILLSSAIAYFLAQRITRPIEYIEALATKAADGDLSVKVDRRQISETAEIHSMANAFSTMITNLNRLVLQKERNTVELARQNVALHESEEKLKAALQALEDEKQKLHTQAITDPLTGLLNRRGFSIAGNKEWQYHLRTRNPLTIAMIDIDYFKRINDEHSHSVGDDVLVELARHLTEHMRQSDLVARIGGEEFALILNQPLPEAEIGLERLRELIEHSPVTSADEQIHYTISIGAVEACRRFISLEAALDAADNNLYAAKRRGRNRVVSELKSA
jgi:diguanylate cyclase (GGDEF)-like protein